MIAWLFFLPFLLPGKFVAADGGCLPGFDLTNGVCFHISSDTEKRDHRGCVHYCSERDSFLAEPDGVEFTALTEWLKNKTLLTNDPDDEVAFVGVINQNNSNHWLWRTTGKLIPPVDTAWNESAKLEKHVHRCVECVEVSGTGQLKEVDDYCTNKTHKLRCLCQRPPRVSCSAGTCVGVFECKNGVCVCPSGHYLDFATNECRQEIQRNGACKSTRQCAGHGINQQSNPSNKIDCIDGKCKENKPVLGTTGHDQPCDDTSECAATLNCTETDTDNKCQCKWHSNYIRGPGGPCKPKNGGSGGVLYGKPCNSNDQCVNAGKCECPGWDTYTSICNCNIRETYNETKENCTCGLDGDPKKDDQCGCTNGYQPNANVTKCVCTTHRDCTTTTTTVGQPIATKESPEGLSTAQIPVPDTTSTVTTAVNDKPEQKSDPPYPLIIGGILGGIVVIGGVGIVMKKYVCPKMKKKKKKKNNADGTDGTESMVSGMSKASRSTVSSVKAASTHGSDTSSVKSGSVRRESVDSFSTQDTLDNGSERQDNDSGSQDSSGSGGSGGSGGSEESGASDRSKGSVV